MKKNRNAESRFDGHDDRSDGAGYVLPQDFEERLERHREASGVTWSALARTIGVDRKPVRRWRTRGVEPSGQIGGK